MFRVLILYYSIITLVNYTRLQYKMIVDIEYFNTTKKIHNNNNEELYTEIVNLASNGNYTGISQIMKTLEIKCIKNTRDSKDYRFEFIANLDGLAKIIIYDHYGIKSISIIKDNLLMSSTSNYINNNIVIKKNGLFVEINNDDIINTTSCNNTNLKQKYDQIKNLISKKPDFYIKTIIEIMDSNNIKNFKFYENDNLNDHHITLNNNNLIIVKYIDCKKVYEEIYNEMILQSRIEYIGYNISNYYNINDSKPQTGIYNSLFRLSDVGPGKLHIYQMLSKHSNKIIEEDTNNHILALPSVNPTKLSIDCKTNSYKLDNISENNKRKFSDVEEETKIEEPSKPKRKKRTSLEMLLSGRK